MFFYDEISTLKNMTPDHIRILDHKFLQSFRTTEESTGQKVKARKVEAIFPDGSVHIFDNAEHAGRVLGVNHKSIRTAIHRGFKSMGCNVRFINV